MLWSENEFSMMCVLLFVFGVDWKLVLTDVGKKNLASAEDDIDKLLAAREDWEAQQQALQQQHQKLADEFKTAASRLKQLETESDGWKEQEKTLSNAASSASQERRALESEKNKLQDELNRLRERSAQSQEDLKRSESRLKSTVTDFEEKIKAANDEAREMRRKHETVDTQARELRQQLDGLSKASSDYEALFKRKEADMVALNNEISSLRSASRRADSEIALLREQLATAEKSVQSYKAESVQAVQARSRVEEEMSQLQSALATKTSEDEKRSLAAQQMSEKLDAVQNEAKALQDKLNETTRLSAQEVAQMTAQLEESLKQRDAAHKAHADQSDLLASNVQRVKDLEQTLTAAERRVATSDAELQSLRARQIEADTQIATLTSRRDDLERQLQNSTSQLRKQEDVALQAERERQSMEQQLTKVKSLLDQETKHRTGLEHAKARAERDFASMQQRLGRQEHLCAELQSELEATTKQLAESKALENKTTIEHVHTLEKAMKLQDRQLAEAQAKFEDVQQLNRTLEKTKSRLTAELQDVSFNTQQNTSATRSQEQQVAKLEQAVKKAQDSLDRERRAREVADTSSGKMKTELRNVQSQLQDALQRASHLEKTKTNLQNELNALARSPSPTFQTFGNVAPQASNNGTVVNGKKQKLLDELARNNAQMSDQIDARSVLFTSLGD